MRSDDIINAARGWLNVRWQHQGRTEHGIDCAGLVILVGKDLGLLDYDFSTYDRLPQQTAFLYHFEDNMDPVELGAECDGDVLVFRQEQYPCHCGILSTKYNKPHLIHAHMPRRRVMEEPYDEKEWKGKFVAAFRYRGVE